MTTADIPRIAAPLLLSAAFVLSAPPRPASPPVELAPGTAPEPAAAEVRAGLAQALAPGAPGYDRGVAHAPVTVIEFLDFGCRYCAQFAAATYPPIAAELVSTGAVRWRVVPFVLGMFHNGDAAARAADCAGRQGTAAFGRMHDRLFARQDEWTAAGDPDGLFESYAQASGLNLNRFASCYAGVETAQRIAAANALADRLGVRATPTFFVAGERVEGALPVAQFRALLLDALRQSRGH